MALVGIQTLSYKELIMQDFHIFQKINLQNFSITWNKITQQLRPSHITSVNYLDLDQAYATHEFQVHSKFLYQNTVSKNWENSRLKTRYLKGITIEQLFIIFIARDYPQSPFIQLLKTKNYTQFLFCFQNLRSHLNIYI